MFYKKNCAARKNFPAAVAFLAAVWYNSMDINVRIDYK